MMLHKIKKIFFLVVIFQTSHVYCMYMETVLYLIQHGDNNSEVFDLGWKGLKRIVSEGGVDKKDCYGYTALHKASRANLEDVVRFLLANGADVNREDGICATPLHYASHVDVMSLLLANGADVNVKNIFGQTPLYFASQRMDKKYARVLLSEAFSTKSPKAVEESRGKAEQVLCAFGELEGDLGKKNDLPQEFPQKLSLLIFSKVPELICSAEMLDAIVPFIPPHDDLAPIIEACSDKCLMMSEKFRNRMKEDEKGDEKAMEAIADVRARQTESLLTIKNKRGQTPVDLMPELGETAFKTKVRNARLARLASYLPDASEKH